MSDVVRPMCKRVGPLLLREDDVHNVDLYKDSLDCLYNICEYYGAVIDLTFPKSIYVSRATKSCRRHIRKVYGKNAIVFRQRTVIELGGFK